MTLALVTLLLATSNVLPPDTVDVDSVSARDAFELAQALLPTNRATVINANSGTLTLEVQEFYRSWPCAPPLVRLQFIPASEGHRISSEAVSEEEGCGGDAYAASVAAWLARELPKWIGS